MQAPFASLFFFFSSPNFMTSHSCHETPKKKETLVATQNQIFFLFVPNFTNTYFRVFSTANNWKQFMNQPVVESTLIHVLKKFIWLGEFLQPRNPTFPSQKNWVFSRVQIFSRKTPPKIPMEFSAHSTSRF